MDSYYLWLLVLGIAAYIMIVDPNVGIYLALVFKMIGVNISRALWLIRFHPAWLNNPITKWRRERHYLNLIKEMQKDE
jgi:hypothetical protein